MNSDIKEVLLYIKNGDLYSFVHAVANHNWNINLDFSDKIEPVFYEYDPILYSETENLPDNDIVDELEDFFDDVRFNGWEKPCTFINVAAFYKQYHICKYILESVRKKELHDCAQSLMKFFCDGSDNMTLFKLFEKYADEELLKESIEWTIEADGIKIFKYITKKLNSDIVNFDYIIHTIKSGASKISKYILELGFRPNKHQLDTLLYESAHYRSEDLFKWIVENYCKTKKDYTVALGYGFFHHLFRPKKVMWLLKTCYEHGVDFNKPAPGCEPVMFYLFDKNVTGGCMDFEAKMLIRWKRFDIGLPKYVDYLVNHGYDLNKARDSLGRNIHEYLLVNSFDDHEDDYYFQCQKILYWVLGLKKRNRKYNEVREERKLTKIPHNRDYVEPEIPIEE